MSFVYDLAFTFSKRSRTQAHAPRKATAKITIVGLDVEARGGHARKGVSEEHDLQKKLDSITYDTPKPDQNRELCLTCFGRSTHLIRLSGQASSLLQKFLVSSALFLPSSHAFVRFAKTPKSFSHVCGLLFQLQKLGTKNG
jgi:hypothetical protein